MNGMTNDDQAPKPKPPLAIAVGQWAQMRKAHPCGGNVWRIVRIGADIGMRCITCDHKVMLARGDFERRLKKLLPAEP